MPAKPQRKANLPPKILPPNLPDEPETLTALTDGVAAAIAAMDDVEDKKFVSAAILSLRARRAVFRGCFFERCAFGENDVSAFEFLDCAFRGCDLSGMRLDGATIQRATFTDCRMTGLYLPDAALRHAVFDNCRMDFVNFGMAKLTNAAFRGCDLSSASFGYAKFDGVVWERCKLHRAELFQTRLCGMDLTTNELDGIVLGDRRELEGATVSAAQAIGIAALLGVKVEG